MLLGWCRTTRRMEADANSTPLQHATPPILALSNDAWKLIAFYLELHHLCRLYRTGDSRLLVVMGNVGFDVLQSLDNEYLSKRMRLDIHTNALICLPLPSLRSRQAAVAIPFSDEYIGKGIRLFDEFTPDTERDFESRPPLLGTVVKSENTTPSGRRAECSPWTTVFMLRRSPKVQLVYSLDVCNALSSNPHPLLRHLSLALADGPNAASKNRQSNRVPLSLLSAKNMPNLVSLSAHVHAYPWLPTEANDALSFTLPKRLAKLDISLYCPTADSDYVFFGAVLKLTCLVEYAVENIKICSSTNTWHPNNAGTFIPPSVTSFYCNMANVWDPISIHLPISPLVDICMPLATASSDLLAPLKCLESLRLKVLIYNSPLPPTLTMLCVRKVHLFGRMKEDPLLSITSLPTTLERALLAPFFGNIYFDGETNSAEIESLNSAFGHILSMPRLDVQSIVSAIKTVRVYCLMAYDENPSMLSNLEGVLKRGGCAAFYALTELRASAVKVRGGLLLDVRNSPWRGVAGRGNFMQWRPVGFTSYAEEVSVAQANELLSTCALLRRGFTENGADIDIDSLISCLPLVELSRDDYAAYNIPNTKIRFLYAIESHVSHMQVAARYCADGLMDNMKHLKTLTILGTVVDIATRLSHLRQCASEGAPRRLSNWSRTLESLKLDFVQKVETVDTDNNHRPSSTSRPFSFTLHAAPEQRATICEDVKLVKACLEKSGLCNAVCLTLGLFGDFLNSICPNIIVRGNVFREATPPSSSSSSSSSSLSPGDMIPTSKFRIVSTDMAKVKRSEEHAIAVCGESRWAKKFPINMLLRINYGPGYDLEQRRKTQIIQDLERQPAKE